MFQVRSLIKLLGSCYEAKNQENTLYKQLFEQKFIDKTKIFYEKTQQKLMKNLNIDKYLKTVDKIFEIEDKMIENYFD